MLYKFSFIYLIQNAYDTPNSNFVIHTNFEDQTAFASSTLHFDVYVGPDPNVFPNYEKTQIFYKWKLNDKIISTSSYLEIFRSNPVNSVLELNILIVNSENPFIKETYKRIFHLSDFASKPLLKVKFSYLQDLQNTVYSNMDIGRFLSYFPAWSSSRKNFFSATSKLFSPLSEQISLVMNELENYITNHFSKDELIHFGYRPYSFEFYIHKMPKLIKTEYGYCGYAGTKLSASLESFPIQAVRTDTVIAPEFQKFFIGETIEAPIHFNDLYHLFICSPSATDSLPLIVTLYGYDANGPITETVTAYHSLSTETVNRFQIITKIDSNKRDLIISNYLDLKEFISFESPYLLPKRITLENGQYFDPLFSLNGNQLTVSNANSRSREDVFVFNLPHIPEKLFINNLLDVIYLYQGSIYSSKVQLDYYQIQNNNSTTNNNPYVYLGSNCVSIGEDIDVTIDVEKLKSNIGCSLLKISILNGDTKLYLDSTGSLTSPDDAFAKNTWINLNNANQRITFSIKCENYDGYLIQIENEKGHSFNTIAYSNLLKAYKLHQANTHTLDIAVANKMLIAKQIINTHSSSAEEKWFYLNPIRLVFVSEKNKLILFNEFKEMEFIYE